MSLVFDVCNISSKSATRGTWPWLQKNESGDSLNIDASFGETSKRVLERGRERSMFVTRQFPTLHLVALSTCSSSERSLKRQKF